MRIALVTVILIGCVSPQAIECGELICAAGSTCDPVDHLCIPPGCGDGVVASNEDCDGALGGDCRDLGYYGPGHLACTKQCEFDTVGCEPAGTCGDLVVNGPELCDGAPPLDVTCADFGFGVGRLGCSVACSPAFAACSPIGPATVATTTHSLVAIATGTDDAFAVGDGGEILHSSGDGWAHIESGTTTDLRAVAVVDGARDAVAVGGGGTIVALRFASGSWNPTVTTVPGLEQINGVLAPAANDVFAVGGASGTGGAIAHFDGTAWTTEYQTPLANFLAIARSSSGQVVAVGRNGMLVRRTGTTWTTATMPASCQPVMGMPTICDLLAVTAVGTVWFATGTTGDTPTAQSPVLRSLDDGQTWSALPGVPIQEPLRAVVVRGEGDIIFAGFGGTMLRFDGQSFHRIATDSGALFNGLALGRRGVLLVAGDGTVRVLEGTTWVDVQSITTVPFRSAATVGGDTYLGGDQDTIMYSSNGVTWTKATVPVHNAQVRGLFAASATEVIAALDAGGGVVGAQTTFANFAPAVVAQMNAVWGSSPTDLYLGGGKANATLFHSTTGSLWTQIASPGKAINGIWGSSATDVFYVGEAGTIAHATGSAFALQTSGVTDSLLGVWGTGPTDVFAVGDNATIVHYDGTTWRRQYAGAQTFTGVFGTAGNDVFAYGPGLVMHYDGVSWSRVATPLATTVGGVTKRDDRTLVFAGSNGTVFTLDRAPVKPGDHEARCTDGWDEDHNGAVDCADGACADDPACRIGGSCQLLALATCGTTIAGTTFTGIGRLDTLPGLTTITDGPEASYRFVAPASGTITVTLAGDASVVVLGTYPNTNACDTRTAIATGNATTPATFAATAGTAYTIVVDAPRGSGGDFTLAIDCP